MLFFGAVMAPLVFTHLPLDIAGPFIRTAFPFYYGYMIIAALVGLIGYWLRRDVGPVLALLLILVVTLWLWLWFIPHLDALRVAGDTGRVHCGAPALSLDQWRTDDRCPGGAGPHSDSQIAWRRASPPVPQSKDLSAASPARLRRPRGSRRRPPAWRERWFVPRLRVSNGGARRNLDPLAARGGGDERAGHANPVIAEGHERQRARLLRRQARGKGLGLHGRGRGE